MIIQLISVVIIVLFVLKLMLAEGRSTYTLGFTRLENSKMTLNSVKSSTNKLPLLDCDWVDGGGGSPIDTKTSATVTASTLS